MKKIAVIGATGRLAPVVIQEMVKNNFKVKALVRNPDKALKLLPKEVEIVKADLEEIDSLIAGLKGIEYVYLNLSTEHPGTSFQPEYDGVRNIVKACRINRIQRIYKISGLGAFRPDFAQGKKIFINEIRNKGQDLIKQSGIPYSFFHPSWFMESLELMFHQDDKLNGFKPLNHPFHWIAGKDYAKMVVSAMNLNVEGNKDYVVQGPEAVSMHDALTRYSNTFQPSLSISETPITAIKFLGLFVPKLKTVGMMGEYFKDFKEEFVGKSTWDELCKPVETIESFRI